MFSKFLLNYILALSVGVVLGAVVPLRARGDIAIVQNQSGDGDTRIYYQPLDEATPTGIAQIVIDGPFDTGRVRGIANIIPANEVLQGTPISSVVYGTFEEIHIFFLSPDRILSEYLYTPSTGLIGGSRCPQCITSKGYKVAWSHNALFATINPTTKLLAVGFVNANDPDTLSEAVRRPNGWVLAPLQNNS